MKKIILPFITAVLFSGSFIAAKYATADLSPLTITLLRYSIALLFLSCLLFHYKTSSLKISKKDIPFLIFSGLLGVVSYHYFFFTSLRFTSVTNTGIIHAFSPVLTAFLAAFFLKEQLTKRNYAGIFIAFIGVLILITHGQLYRLTSLDFNLGDLLMLAAVLSWVAYCLIIKKLSNFYHAFTLTFYATFFGVTLLLFLVPFEQSFYRIPSFPLSSFYPLLYMGIFSSGIGYLLYNFSIQDVGPTRTATLVYSGVPLFVALLSFVFFQETITFSIIISLVLILLGLHLALSNHNSYKYNITFSKDGKRAKTKNRTQKNFRQ